MKFTNLMQNFITFLDNKDFNYTINNKNLYDKNKEKHNEIFSSGNLNNKLDDVLKKIYLDFYNANKHFLKLKSENKKIFTIEIKNINHINDIPKSDSMFNSTYFPDKLQKVINDESNYSITFTFKLQDRNIKVNMIISEQETLFDIEKYEKYMENIYIWFYIASQHAYKYCSKNLHIYIYLTDVKRQLPSSNIHILDAININGGISNVCVQNSISEIVIYRKEEWFKVLIHETFHNYGLDFSDLMINSMKEKVKNLFPIQSNMELFEAYTECWGEIINMGFICYLTIEQVKTNKEEKFIQLMRELLTIEKSFSLFQCNKILQFMNLEYEDLFKNDPVSKLKRNNFYKENTNVFPYYFVKCILMYYCEDFLIWNNENNTSLLRFNKTNNNLHNFYLFIEEHYQHCFFLQDMKKMNKHYMKLLKTQQSPNEFKTTMRMSICEFY